MNVDGCVDLWKVNQVGVRNTENRLIFTCRTQLEIIICCLLEVWKIFFNISKLFLASSVS